MAPAARNTSKPTNPKDSPDSTETIPVTADPTTTPTTGLDIPAAAPGTVPATQSPDAVAPEATKRSEDAVTPDEFPDPSEDAPEPLTSDPADGSLAVILKVQVSGTRDGKDWPAPGTLVVLPKEEALGLVRGGTAALPVRPGAEKAVDTAPVEYAAELAKESIKAD